MYMCTYMFNRERICEYFSLSISGLKISYKQVILTKGSTK